jgi:hypothetical protein
MRGWTGFGLGSGWAAKLLARKWPLGSHEGVLFLDRLNEYSDRKVRDDGKLIQRCFLDIIYRCNLYLKRRFGDWNLSGSSGKKFTQFGLIDRASPYLRTNIIFSRQNLYNGVRCVADVRWAEVASVSEKYILITIEAHRIAGGLVYLASTSVRLVFTGAYKFQKRFLCTIFL